ncbi:MAG: GerAB/ArcD/ProY family transporter [Firmicutes bacterium]|nr:GerAB/ArcD/ProY family transporter [Bacillota bacterium]
MTGYPQTQGKLGHRETAIMLAITISARLFLWLPNLLAAIGGPAGWLVLTVAFGGAMLGYFFLDRVLARFPGQDLIDIGREVLGGFHVLFGLAFFLFFSAILSTTARQFAETFVVGILPRTPIGVVYGLLLILLVFAAYMGLETISRLAMLYAPYLLLFLTVIFLLVLPNANPLYLTPLWGFGLRRIILGGLPRSSIFAEIVLLGFFVPALREERHRRGIGFWALGVSYLLFLVSTLIFTAVFDLPGAAESFFPVYQLARLISLAEFFQRAEAVFIFLWFFTAVIESAVLFYAAVYVRCRTFSLPSHRPLLFPLAVIIYSVGFIPDSFAQALRFD